VITRFREVASPAVIRRAAVLVASMVSDKVELDDRMREGWFHD